MIGQVFFRDNALVIQNVDGSRVTMPVQDAQQLLFWLLDHNDELRDRIDQAKRSQQHEQEQPETAYLNDPTIVSPGWLGERYDEEGD